MFTSEAAVTLGACTLVAAVCGLAQLLRPDTPVTISRAVRTAFYSATMGLVIGCLWYKIYAAKSDAIFLIGAAGLAGLTGLSIVEFLQKFSQVSTNFLPQQKRKRDDSAPDDKNDSQGDAL